MRSGEIKIKLRTQRKENKRSIVVIVGLVRRACMPSQRGQLIHSIIHTILVSEARKTSRVRGYREGGEKEMVEKRLLGKAKDTRHKPWSSFRGRWVSRRSDKWGCVETDATARER